MTVLSPVVLFSITGNPTLERKLYKLNEICRHTTRTVDAFTRATVCILCIQVRFNVSPSLMLSSRIWPFVSACYLIRLSIVLVYLCLTYLTRCSRTYWLDGHVYCMVLKVYIDVLESVNLLMSSNGAVLRNDVSGKVIMKTLLSGTSSLSLSLALCKIQNEFDALGRLNLASDQCEGLFTTLNNDGDENTLRRARCQAIIA